jgi:hypothetical protein
MTQKKDGISICGQTCFPGPSNLYRVVLFFSFIFVKPVSSNTQVGTRFVGLFPHGVSPPPNRYITSRSPTQSTYRVLQTLVTEFPPRDIHLFQMTDILGTGYDTALRVERYGTKANCITSGLKTCVSIIQNIYKFSCSYFDNELV